MPERIGVVEQSEVGVSRRFRGLVKSEAARTWLVIQKQMGSLRRRDNSTQWGSENYKVCR
jgi:hypothetical protein